MYKNKVIDRPVGNPLISIITVVYNGVNTLEATIQSIINQNYDLIEYIVIDGESKDGTIEIIKKYQSKITYWLSEKDNGIYDAMNKAIELVNGDWVIFINSGDKLASADLLSSLTGILTDPNTVYYGDILYEGRNIYGGKFNLLRITRLNISHQAIFYPVSVFKKYHYRYNLKYHVLADHNLNIELFGNKSVRFKYIKKVISICESCDYSRQNKDICFEENRLNIIKQNLGYIPMQYKKIRTLLHKLLS